MTDIAPTIWMRAYQVRDQPYRMAVEGEAVDLFRGVAAVQAIRHFVRRDVGDVLSNHA